ncbi:MAG: DoxX family membrane protein [Polyangia bacterium]
MPETTPALLPIRLFVGWVFLRASLAKLSTGWLEQPRLAAVLEGWLKEGHTYALYRPFLHDVVLPHAQLFSWLVCGGELLVGAALLAGIITRGAALGGLVLTTSFLLARGDGADANQTAPFVAMTLALLFAHTGRTLGLDAALAHKLPRWLT